VSLDFGRRKLDHFDQECFVHNLKFHNLKRFRAIATRYEKTARNYLALVQLACARLWLES
jgi:transposase